MKRQLILLLPLVAVVSCSGSTQSSVGSKLVKSSGAASIRNDKVDTERGSDVGVIGGASFTVKNYIQLKNATEQCLGQNLGTVTVDMIQGGKCPGSGNMAAAAAADRKPILGQDKCALVSAKANIIDANKTRLWDPESASRTATLANTLNPDYLAALAEVADVYAYGVQDPMALCSTVEAATKLVGSCLGQYEPAALTTVVNQMQVACAKGSNEARAAIASMIGSAAFAAGSK